jgi:hypothetical protein
MLWSTDGGYTWSPEFGESAYTVIRSRRGTLGVNPLWTDQMPSVIEVKGTSRLIAATESYDNANYNISMAWSGADGLWPRITDSNVGPTDRSINMFKGAAPCLNQFTSGETYLTYNENNAFYGRLGDANAENWSSATDLFPKISSTWGCSYIDSDHSILFAWRNSSSIDIKRYFLNHAITATQRTPSIDADNSEWATTDDAIFVGANGQAQATLRCASDNDNYYFLVEVRDMNISKDDYFNILLSPTTSSGKINSEARRIKVAPYGLLSTDQYAGGWHEISMNVTTATAFDGSISDNSDTDNGYLAEVKVPKSEINVNGDLLVNLVLFDAESGEDAVSPTTDKSLAKWIPVME